MYRTASLSAEPELARLPDFDTLQRFQLLELVLQWQGRLITTHLMQAFGLSRNSASRVINQYKNLHPQQMHYCTQDKGYMVSEQFQPKYTRATLEEYSRCFGAGDADQAVAAATGQSQAIYSFSASEAENVSMISGPVAKLDAARVRPILYAIHQNQRLDIRYTSLSNPHDEGRIISPHSLVFTGLRWHVRAWCGKNQDFRDFVLSRISQIYDLEGPSQFSREDDHNWQQQLQLTLIPDQRLNAAQQQVIANDYQMKQSQGRWQRQLSVPAALLIYWLQYLRLDRYNDIAEVQQIQLAEECWPELVDYLPNNWAYPKM